MARNPVPPHEEEALGRAYDARLMRRLLTYLRPYRWRVAAAITLLMVGALVELAGPWLTKIALDQAIPNGDTRLILLLATLFLGALLTAFALEAGQTIITAWLGQRVMYDLRRQIFGRLQRLELAYFDRNPVGRLMTRVTSDVEVLNELFSSGVVSVFGDIFTLLFIIGAMLLLDWRLALVTLAVVPAVFIVALTFRGKIRSAYRDIRVRLARINAFLQERLTGIAVVQLFGKEAETDREFRDIDANYLSAHLRSITYYALFFPIMELLTAVSLALILSYGGAGILRGTVTVGVLAAFLQYARRFFRPIQDLSEKYNMLQGAMAASERIFKLLDTEPAPTEAGGHRHLRGPVRGAIEFRNVWFAYGKLDDGSWDWVLRDVSFRAEPGQRVALVGHTGAGKTTIASLLLRFYEPQRGDILVDGQPIRDMDLGALRATIGLVLQDIFLFSRDIAYNIRLGRADIDETRVRNALERVGAAPVVEQLPGGLAQPLGERGASLSVGERQLLSFARVLAHDPPILVLDEATSSVDSRLEKRIEDAVDSLMRGRTALVIAHRLSTVQGADRIIVLHHGELRESGTHAQLLAQDGLYRRLYTLQFVPAGHAATSPDNGERASLETDPNVGVATDQVPAVDAEA